MLSHPPPPPVHGSAVSRQERDAFDIHPTPVLALRVGGHERISEWPPDVGPDVPLDIAYRDLQVIQRCPVFCVLSKRAYRVSETPRGGIVIDRRDLAEVLLEAGLIHQRIASLVQPYKCHLEIMAAWFLPDTR